MRGTSYIRVAKEQLLVGAHMWLGTTADLDSGYASMAKAEVLGVISAKKVLIKLLTAYNGAHPIGPQPAEAMFAVAVSMLWVTS